MRRSGAVRVAFPTASELAVARLTVAVIVVLIALVGGPSINMRAVIVLAIAAAVLSGLALLWVFRATTPRLLPHVQFTIDVVLVTVLLWYTGGAVSPFKFLFLLPVIVAAAKLGTRAASGIAATSVAGYVAVAVLGSGDWSFVGRSGVLAEFATLVVSLALVVVLVGALASRAGSERRALAATRSDLETANLRMSSIVESLRSGLVLVDHQGRVAYINRVGQTILGGGSVEYAGLEYRVAFAEVPAFCERIASALDAGRPESRGEFYVRRRDGSAVPVGLSTSILRDESGVDRGVVAIFQDLTDVRRLEERARHADQLAVLGEFAAGIAHEIRNPLNVIKGSIDLLREGLEDDGDEARLAGLVSREADRLSKLVNDVLRYGRMDPGDRDPVRLDELVREVAVVLERHESRRPGTAIEIVADHPVTADINEEQIKQVILNLGVNALEAIEDEGLVRISVVPPVGSGRGVDAGAREGEVAVIVEDTGCGMAGGKLDEIFQPFRTSKKHGTGLGLAIVDKIMEAHGGRVTARSTLGKGSTFVICLAAHELQSGRDDTKGKA